MRLSPTAKRSDVPPLQNGFREVSLITLARAAVAGSTQAIQLEGE
jgi:hypothetical protein